MPSLIDDLAQRLDISTDEARRQLGDLVSDFRSHVEREGRSTLPGLGTFSKDERGWSFEPTAPLARSVNRSFDDLQPVRVSARRSPGVADEHEASAAPATDSPTPEEDSEPPARSNAGEENAEEIAAESGPPEERDVPADRAPATPDRERPANSSIFDSSEDGDERSETPSPGGLFGRDLSEEPADEAESDEDSIGEPDFEETPPAAASSPDESFAPPEKQDREAATPPASEEPIPGETEPAPERPATQEPTAEGEEEKEDAWAVPASSTTDAPGSSAWDYAALPAGYLLHRAVRPEAGDLRSGRLQRPSDHPADASAAPEASDPAPRRAPDRGPAEASPDARPSENDRAPASDDASKGGSGLAGWLAALLVLVLIAFGAWYLLGQQDSTTDSVASSGSPPPAQTEEAPPGEEAASGGASAPGGAAATPADSAAAATRPDPPSPAAQAFEEAARLDRAAGGWTIVVASETSREVARRTAQQFAQQFQGQDYPIDIVEANVGGTPRFRVVVGQFASAAQASDLLSQTTGGPSVPQDAWALEL